MTAARFRKIIREHYRKSGRHSFPWRKTRDPYRILVSEIMLQQTQVGRVEGFYERFIARFPGFGSLARATPGDVLRLWQGLGYNRRALMLHKLARIVVRDFGGKLPDDREILESLPGIGPGTSGALRAFAFNRPDAFIETNIRRVFIHFFFPKKKMVTDRELARYIKRTIDLRNPREWYWALMDYGAMLAKSARGNPNRRSAHYVAQSPFAGSRRELRGKILRILLVRKQMTRKSLAAALGAGSQKFDEAVAGLTREGFVGIKGDHLCIK